MSASGPPAEAENAATSAETDVRWRAFAELTKPKLTSLVLVTTALGYLLARTGPVDWWKLTAAVLGTALVGGGANGLNQWWEVERDARMNRSP